MLTSMKRWARLLKLTYWIVRLVKLVWELLCS